MELKEIAVVSGKPGLFKIVKPAVNGVILEALDGTSSRFIANKSTKVSILGEISVYTEGGDNIALEEVFRTIYGKHGKTISVDTKSSDSQLRSFFTDLIPEHDKQRVYTSDIKKIVVWYSILVERGFEEQFASKPEAAEETESKKGKKATTKEVEATSETPKKEKAAKEPKTAAKKETASSEEKKPAKAPVAKKATK